MPGLTPLRPPLTPGQREGMSRARPSALPPITAPSGTPTGASRLTGGPGDPRPAGKPSNPFLINVSVTAPSAT